MTAKEIEQLTVQPGSQMTEVYEHLESCAQCRDKLEVVTDGSWWWNEGRELVASSWRIANAVASIPSPFTKKDFGQAEAEVKKLTGSFQSPLHPELLGKVGDYDVHSLIGMGGMGAVFKGFDQELNRPVAIKFLLPRHATCGLSRQRFSREARAMAAVRHENVIPVFRIDANAEYPHFAMPLVAGVSLQQYVDLEGMMDPEQLVQIAAQISAGLQAAHEKGLIHRDVKPSNILLENRCNRVVVTDFGLAREESDLSLTQTGMVAGTPQYMSPEQADGRQIDHRSDLFSLGAVMYFMATGRPPFKGANQLDVLKNIRKEKQLGVRNLNPSIPQRLEQLIERLLEKDPSKRLGATSDAQEFLKNYSAHFRSPKANAEPKLSPRYLAWSKPMLVAMSLLVLIVVSAVPPLTDGLSEFWNGTQPGISTQAEDPIAPIALESEEMNAYFANADNVPKVHGVLTNFTRAELSDLVIKYVIQVPSKLQLERTVEIDRNGRFELKMDYPLPYQEVMLIVGDAYFRSFVVHKDLTVRIDMSQLRKSTRSNADKAVEFTGADAEMVQYQINYRIEVGEALRALTMEKVQKSSIRTVGLQNALRTHEKAHAAEKRLIDSYVEKNPSPFEWLLQDDFQSRCYSDLMAAHSLAGKSIPDSLWNEILKHQPKQLTSRSSGYFHDLNIVAGFFDKHEVWKQAMEERFNKPKDQRGIKDFLNLYSRFRRDNRLPAADRKAYQKGKEAYLEPCLDRVIELSTEIHLNNLKKLPKEKAGLAMVLGARAVNDPMAFVPEIMPLLEDGWCKTLLVEEYQKDIDHRREVTKRIKRAKSTGAEKLGDRLMSSDGIHMFYGNHQNPSEIAESLVNSFPGKAVIVDFWSLGCGACLDDMKRSNDVKAELAKLPVEIVYVCLDSQYEQWMEKIVSSDVKGNHLFLDKNLSAAASEHFKIVSHPSFIFIDQDGNYDPDLIRFLSEIDIGKLKSRLK